MSGDGMNHLTNNQAGSRRKGNKKKRPGKEQDHGWGGGGFDGGGNNFAPPPPTHRLIKAALQFNATTIIIIIIIHSKETRAEVEDVVCGNALEETRGKELELSNDYIVNQLYGFLQNSSNLFPLIAMDRSALAVHLQDNDVFASIEETLTKICQVVVVEPVDMIFGSHVRRSLLFVCKDIGLFARVSCNKYAGNSTEHLRGFPDILKFLVTRMIECVYCNSPSWSTALKLLPGEDKELMNIITITLACHGENTKGNFYLLQLNSYKKKKISNRLFEVSSTHFGSFVIQPL
ncbi:hypothetical protein MKW92_015457, partial [Papaver armeniacum]